MFISVFTFSSIIGKKMALEGNHLVPFLYELPCFGPFLKY